MPLFGSLFGRKETPQAAPRRTFDFPFGVDGVKDVLQLTHAAVSRDDEAELRAIFEFLETHISRDEADAWEASKPTLAAVALGKWLIRAKRFAEAEIILKRARGFKKVLPAAFLDSRLLLAEAIWEQGDRARAEKEALVFVEKVLAKTDNQQWPLSEHRAKLAQSRFDFAEKARWEEKAFEEAPDEKPGALEKRRADPRLHLKAALAWHEAGHNTPALEHVERALELATTTGNRVVALSAMSQMSYWLSRGPRFEEVPFLSQRALEVAGEDEALQLKARRIAGSIALRWGRFDDAQALLATPEAEVEDVFRAVTMEHLAALLQFRGHFDEARRLIEQKALLFPVTSRVGSRMIAMNHLSRVGLELRAHYVGQPARLDQSVAALAQAQTLLSGDRKLETWVRAFSIAVQAARGEHEGARTQAYSLETEFGKWSDSGDTQSNLAELLLLCFLWIGDARRAALWGDWLLYLTKAPVPLASARELAARAHFQSGEANRARELWTQVAACDFDSTAVRLAKDASKIHFEPRNRKDAPPELV